MPAVPATQEPEREELLMLRTLKSACAGQSDTTYKEHYLAL